MRIKGGRSPTQHCVARSGIASRLLRFGLTPVNPCGPRDAHSHAVGRKQDSAHPREPAVQYTLMLWHADHVNFSRLLNLLQAQLRRVNDADARTTS